MERFEELTSTAAPLLEDNIDTDVIFPARFLLLLDRQGLGRHAFSERRNAQPPFVLESPEYAGSRILVTGQNFGTGSSREQAVWALADLGIRCIIAPSFGEIFHTNCFKNGVLPIILDKRQMQLVAAAALAREPITVNLDAQEVRLQSGDRIGFELAPFHKRLLMLGLDEIGLILTEERGEIEAFERSRKRSAPWIDIAPERFASLQTKRESLDADNG